MENKEEILIECKCGKTWWIDFEPTPETCEDDIWRIWIGGSVSLDWVDRDGNTVRF